MTNRLVPLSGKERGRRTCDFDRSDSSKCREKATQERTGQHKAYMLFCATREEGVRIKIKDRCDKRSITNIADIRSVCDLNEIKLSVAFAL